MERIIVVAIIGILIFIIINLSQPEEPVDEYVGEVEKQECASCNGGPALMESGPKASCASGMCSTRSKFSL